MSLNLTPLYLSLYVAITSSVLLLFISIPVSWVLSRYQDYFFIRFLEVVVSLPLVLPPTVLGFYLLIIFNPEYLIGKLYFKVVGENILFSTAGLIFASILYSLPFAVQPMQVAFKKINTDIIDQCFLLQSSKFKVFFSIILPLSKNGVLSSFILSFAHTLGEFGVVLMVGGNIPGKTQVISIAIYESVEMLNFYVTHVLSLIILLISFVILFLLFSLNRHEN
ncbi:MAG: molybdate ABC transporter permease subunit [Candidatus Riesia sp.]|nr:molybdate ABC transporter permease subunit [Candidatus Riesia sp.]